jgi:hypothetical protein
MSYLARSETLVSLGEGRMRRVHVLVRDRPRRLREANDGPPRCLQGGQQLRTAGIRRMEKALSLLFYAASTVLSSAFDESW